jgi:thymidylate synthase (FAD)
VKRVTILTEEPTVAVLGEMQLNQGGMVEMAEWVRAHRPECLPEEYEPHEKNVMSLFPHQGDDKDGGSVTDNELLVELAGRKCYDSFGLKAGRKSNAEYIANTQAGDIVHASIMYHAKMSFFIAGVSRRVSHELIRNYVGADRDEEGSPSQESTRFTHHYGFYVAHPYLLRSDLGASVELSASIRAFELDAFRDAMQNNYDCYLAYIDRRVQVYAKEHGAEPKGMDRKRIYESASSYLSHACETSWVWTSNPIALAKMFRERDNDGADLEFRRLAKKWKRICVERWPALFPQSWMHE